VLTDGFHDVPPGRIAAVVTALEMRARPALRSEPTGDWTLRDHRPPDPDWFRDLYSRVGNDWLWWSRLSLDDAGLMAIVGHPDVEVRSLEAGSRSEGLLELDFREAGECELSFFGLSPALVGHGAGRWLMNRALELAWARPIQRLWVHTCTLDHPDALEFYIRSGFTPYRRQVEIVADPRLTGVLPAAAGPRHPVV
jgi:GNAT superfamily N-acetyltransferase